MGGRYHLLTFGCQMNKYDSEKLAGVLSQSGFTATDDPARADVILLNTCSIRKKAEDKVYSKLGRIAEARRSGQVVALGGCMATFRKEEIFRRAPVVDVLFGPDAIERLPRMIEECRATRERRTDVGFGDHTVWDSLPDGPGRQSGVSAWVGIMKGCDNRCSYCVVPATRGPEVSRPAASALAEVEDLVRKGFREINLLGQNVNSYGKGLVPEVDFPSLLTMVARAPGVERVRFMSSHPKDLNDRLIEVMASEKTVCPSFHLPLQAGSDRVLAMMKRNYTAAEYMEKVRRLRAAVPGMAVSTDVMVGFPGETEEEFLQTLRVMEEARFDSLFLFNYSPRPGTPAGAMEGELPRAVCQERFDRALALHRRIVGENLRALVGSRQEVLCEGPANEPGKMFGRTPGNHITVFSGGAAGRTLPITITGVLGYNLAGIVGSATF